MKNKKIKSAGFSFVGAVLFFVLIAFVIQVSVLVYEFIRLRTDNKLLIAILILVVVIILSAICTLVDMLRRKITIDRPTKKILTATEQIAKGDFKVKLNLEHEYGKYNEYDLIMENINKMALELQKNEVLKTDFIANVSHEIKTPLAIIQNYATLIQDDSLDAETRKSHAKTLINASKRITDLITNILKLNKLEHQQILDKKEEFNLTEALAETIVQYETLIEKKNIELDCDLDEVKVLSNRSLLELIWNNLISNAVKFTPENGKIKILEKVEDKNVRISVEDTGIGISPEVGERIFEKFYQGDESHSKEGNGLGLALVKKVVDVLGGEIFVQSEVGKGSIFTVLLKDVVNEN